MKAQSAHPAVYASLALLLLISGCKSTQSSAPQPQVASHWAVQARETAAPIPTVEEEFAAPLSTPTEVFSSTAAIPWGAPRNLTQTIASKKSVAAPKPAAKKSNHTGSGRGNGNGAHSSSHITVNVHSLGLEETTPATTATPDETSRLETLYSGSFTRAADRNLTQFGYDYFQNADKKAASAAGPVPSDFRIGPNDELIITLSGGVEAYHRLTVDRDGFLNIPDFGPVSVANLAYADLYDALYAFLSERRTGFTLTVSMGRLRVIRVNVVGRVANPGIVEIPALNSPIDALSAAGGPLKSGSLRSIKWTRRNAAEEDALPTIDLYTFLRNPDAPLKTEPLQDGDTLHVPAIGATIGIAGYVQQPAIYELVEAETNVADAIALASGLTPFSFTPLAHVERTIEGRGRQRIGVELNPEGMQQTMGDGELLLIEAVDGKRQPIVRIEGEVSRPGDYEFRPGMKLSELVERADGLTVDAYLPQVFISRQIGQADAIENIASRAGHSQTRRVIVSDLAEAVSKNPFHDIVLMPLDLITVRSHRDAQPRPVVEIIGSVQHPGSYELTAGMRVADLVAIAGNPNPDVYYDEAELIRRVFDETNRRLDVRRYRFDLRHALDHPTHPQLNPVLANGDRLVIRALQQAQVRVRIDGLVRFPGEYVFPAGSRISDLVTAAGGILHEADLSAAVFTRVSTQKLQQQRLDHLEERTRRLFENALQKMVQTGHAREGLAAQISLTQTMDTVDRIQANEADGRIVIPFDRPDFPRSQFDLPLESGDRLYIPKRHTTISIAGHVFRPISLVADEPITIKDALASAGGLTEAADSGQLYVIRADGSVNSIAQKSGKLRKTDPLHPGDVLLAPRKAPERTMAAQLSDALHLARQAAELGLITSNIGEQIDFTLVQPNDTRKGAANPDIFLDQVK